MTRRGPRNRRRPDAWNAKAIQTNDPLVGGFEAAIAGLPQEANPYGPGERRDLWTMGWHDAADEAQRDERVCDWRTKTKLRHE